MLNLSLPAFSLKSGSAPKHGKKSTFLSTWLPAIGAALLVAFSGSAAFNHNAAISLPSRNLVVAQHHEAVFGSSSESSVSVTVEASWKSTVVSWFNDAKEPATVGGLVRDSKKGRRPWGTGRSYPPPVDSINGRALYDAHVDVSDQFTSFGKVSVAVLYALFWVLLMFVSVVSPLFDHPFTPD